MSPSQRALCVACLLCSGLGWPWRSGAALAQERRVRVVVYAQAAVGAALARRLRGQVSDLPVQLRVQAWGHTASEMTGDATAPLVPDDAPLVPGDAPLVPDDADLALWLAYDTGAQARAWLLARQAGRGPVVLTELPVQRGRGRFPLTSSALETAALVGRTAIETLHGQGLSQQAVPTTVHSEPPEQAQEPQRAPSVAANVKAPGRDAAAAAAKPPRSPEAATAARKRPSDPRPNPTQQPAALGALPTARLGSRTGAGSESTTGGVPVAGLLRLSLQQQSTLALARGPLGAALWAGMLAGPLQLGVHLGVSLPQTVDDAFGAVHIAQHALLGTAALRLLPGTVSVWLGARSGLALFHRVTRSADGFAGRPAALTPSWVVGPTLAVQWQPGQLGGQLQVALDAFPAAPRFVYAGTDAPTRPAYTPATLALQISLGLQARVL